MPRRKQRKDTRKSKRDLSDEYSNVYERMKKLQNENKLVNISSMQTVGKKNMSAMENLIIMNAIVEKIHKHKNTYIFYVDAEKCFDKLWLKDSLKEMERRKYNRNDTEILYEIHKTAEINVDSAIGNTKSI